MEASWSYVSRLAQRSEQIGYDLTLIAEAPSLDAWSTAVLSG
jgi:FMNH2-dependent dimethyl sulfone monooxygenase